ncbi:3'-5' exonuclease [Yersinia ruckeri]|uniref:3'-5' exonuclease n=1 Tax=Yersinia ruckeri TaxID=29486 RepID=UPI0020BE1F68|nr:3'-5' exonuclease [Yersinia ruckeri]MCK8542057.1 3'-5' exonuclease [Yersinia ruckeri]MCK8553129.1 3'-5' exonuclease [Yersinia ruckeri]MCW6519253.1 3'-5' exonuclease [Yersinia ruckeri]MCW6553507.1 3'-5' exonuclease [Yersinia ruckeri]MCW6579646.1 3'-5' exonuclease [Yersinia ruckeri]
MKNDIKSVQKIMGARDSFKALFRVIRQWIKGLGNRLCKLGAQHRAKKWLKNNCLILDTETTGLGDDAEIVEITIIDCTGKILLDTLVKPIKTISAAATAIHGITNEMVAAAPTWREIHWQFMVLTNDRTLLIYNALFDTRLIFQTAAANNCQFLGKKYILEAECVMEAYAEYFGERDRKRNKYKWQRLNNAAKQQGVVIEGAAHRALSDCKTTLGIIRAMAGGAQCN